LLFGVLGVGGTREHGRGQWWLRVRPKLFTLVFLVCSINAHFYFLQILVKFIWLQDLKKVCLVWLHMTRGKERWW
jgi:hypothetical protein